MHPVLRGLAATALTSTALAAPAQAAKLTGVVVHDNHRAHSFVVAGHDGKLSAVHAHRLPRLASRVTVLARPLLNGTFRAERVKAGRRAHRAVIRGTVTYVDASRQLLTVSARGVSLLVHAPGTRRHGVRLATDAAIEVGSIVTVEGSLEGNTVQASDLAAQGHDAGAINLEGAVQALDATNRTLTLSADDSELSGATVTVALPVSFDLSLFTVGGSVELTVSASSDGTFTLVGSSDDSGAAAANNPDDAQGDDHGDGRGGGAGGSSAGGGSDSGSTAQGGEGSGTSGRGGSPGSDGGSSDSGSSDGSGSSGDAGSSSGSGDSGSSASSGSPSSSGDSSGSVGSGSDGGSSRSGGTAGSGSGGDGGPDGAIS